MTREPSPRWRRRKQARPQEIVEAALAVFAERGFAATRLDEVAARAGVSKGTLYLYFSSKEELFKAVVRESVLPNLARAEAMIADNDGPTAALLGDIVAMMSRVLATTAVGAIPKLVIAEAGNFPDIARFYVEEVASRGLALVRRIVVRGVERGEFRPVDPDHAARIVVAPAIFMALWQGAFARFEERPLDLQRHVETYLAVVLDGLRAQGSGGPA